MFSESATPASLGLERFSAQIDEACALLAPYGDRADLAPLRELRRAFAAKAQDFFREGRCFTIAVLGQVKAGKSSFLNELFFPDDELLPQASLPKTAVLTKLEYAPETQLVVEYYSQADWAALERDAAAGGPQSEAAREMIASALACGAARAACAAKGSERFSDIGAEELRARIEACVSETGPLSPLVKSVTIGLCSEALRGIVIVDTPGLNDPVRSRTQCAKDLIELSDAAFFLSRSSSFLDENDMRLLAGQLPRKGVRRLVVVASQFDSALMDTVWDAGSLEQAQKAVRSQLTLHAADSISAAVARMRRAGIPAAVTDVLTSCRTPVFCSVMAHRMARKTPEDDTAQQRVIRSVLSCRGPVSAAQLAAIGGMDEVRGMVETLCAEKDAALRRKAADFLLIAKTDFSATLAEISARASADLRALETPRAQAQERLAQLNRHISLGQEEASGIFSEYTQRAPELFREAMRALRAEAARGGMPAAKTDVLVHSHAETVSDSVFYKPWTWGRRHREYTAQQTVLHYNDVTDTLETLRLFTDGAIQLHARIWDELLNTSHLQNRLNALSARFTRAAGAPYTPEQLSAITQRALNVLTAPRFAPNCEPLCQRLARQFPGRQLSAAEQQRLSQARAGALAEWADALACAFEESQRQFERTAAQAQERYLALLAQSTEARCAECREQLEALRRKTVRTQELLELIARC